MQQDGVRRAAAAGAAVTLALSLAGCGGDDGGDQSTDDTFSDVARLPSDAKNVSFVVLDQKQRFEVTLLFDQAELTPDAKGCEGGAAPANAKWARIPYLVRNPSPDATLEAPAIGVAVSKPSSSEEGRDEIVLDPHTTGASTGPCGPFRLHADAVPVDRIGPGQTVRGTLTTPTGKAIVDPSQWTFAFTDASRIEGDAAAVSGDANRNWVIAANRR